jgi:anti-sigma factor RsiW
MGIEAMGIEAMGIEAMGIEAMGIETMDSETMDSETMDSEAMNIDAMKIDHARPLIPDYVLGLLSADESRRVESHAQQCPACREAIRRERQIEALVRQSVQAAARPPAGRLAQLRPAPRRAAPLRRQLYRQLAPLTALAVLLVVVLLAQTGGLWTPAFARGVFRPPADTATATMTHTPTATLAATDGATAPATVASTATTATAAATLTRAARSDASPAPAAPRPSQALIPNGPTAQATPIVVNLR